MSVKRWSVALLCGALLALPVSAQEDTTPKEEPKPATEAEPKPAEPAKTKGYEEPPLHRWGGWTISLAAWQPTLVGADEDVAVVFPDDAIPYTLRVGSSDRVREALQVAYHLPKGVGTVLFKYDSMLYDDGFASYTPGRFDFLEIRAFPGFRGAFDDGFADGVETHALRKSRMASLQFTRLFVDTKHARVTWGAGMQNIDHSRTVDINYLAIVANLPPVIPPILPEAPDPAQYNPRPDIVHVQSDYSGNGIVGSIDVEFPFHPRVSLVSGLSIGLMRGDLSTVYTSKNAFYFDGLDPSHIYTTEELFAVLSGNDADQIKAVSQGYAVAALQTTRASHSAQTYDAYIGLQANVWRGLKVFALYRDITFANAAASVTPRTDNTIEYADLASAYDGYMVGVSWRF